MQASLSIERNMRRGAVAAAFLLVLSALLATARSAAAAEEVRPPNLVVIFCDNLGYGDIGCFGSKRNRTPHLDKMAEQGLRLTSFYAASGVCTPSRASLMTGCYPRRVNMEVDENGTAVLRPVARKGLNPREITIAEVLKQQGYATACVGKWHLGDQPAFLPTRQGFDHYFGIPYSDDMTPRPGRPWPPLPLMLGEKVIEAPVERDTLTRRLTEDVVKFIETNRQRPFFVYMPQAMPGSTKTAFASEAFRGKSGNGTYGDSIEELDWSTGEILSVLKRLGLDKNTLVVWTSDNGSVNRQHSSNLPLSGWGYGTTEGSMRVPCIVRWPGKIPAGKSCDEVATTMDLLPTFARLAGGKPPSDRIIDGRDIWPLLAGEKNARSPHEAFYYYMMKQLHAVRSGKWKLFLPLAAKQTNLRGDKKASEARLYDLVADIGESKNLADQNPEVVKRLMLLADQAREDLGDLDRPGKNQRQDRNI